MTTFAKDLPFAANEDHNFVHLIAPSVHFPSHFIPPKSGRYFPNYDGHVYCPEEYVPVLLAEGCKLADGVHLGPDPAAAPAVPAPSKKAPAGTETLPVYQPLTTPNS